MTLRPLCLPVLLLAAACAAAPAPPGRTAPSTDIVKAREAGAEQAFAWADLTPETLARARGEGRLILLHGAAIWCHWCHVMEEVTYRDARVGEALRERFVAVRVDIDARPDIADRYGDYGWPATIILSPEAEELGKYRGYLPPDELLAILGEVGKAAARPGEKRDPLAISAPVAALPWVAARAARDFDAYWDAREGGWGQRQKAPIGANITFEMRRAARGDAAALARATFTVTKQRALVDPVWGGIYQYSAGSTWTAPHFEKLMTYQAANIEAYASVVGRTKDADVARDLGLLTRYLTTFLSNEGGGFLVSQDADAGSHDSAARFVEGRAFYALGDADRRKVGAPHVDDHVYAYENGLAIAALCAAHDATRDEALVTRARWAADLVLRTHVTDDGGVLHDASVRGGPRYLGDAAALGRALARLAEVTGDARYEASALRVAQAMERDLGDAAGGGYWAHTVDPRAAGVFARREKPFASQVLAARFLAALGRLTGDASHTERARATLAAAATPKALDAQGRMLGELLLALDDVGLFPW